MSNIRVYELAKEFNKETKEVLEVLQKGGFSVKNNFSSVGDAEREALKKHYHKGAAPASKVPAKEAKPKAEVKEVRENAPEKKKEHGEKSQNRPQNKGNHEHKEHRENRDNNQRKASSNNGNGNNRSHEGGSRGGHSEHNNNNNNDRNDNRNERGSRNDRNKNERNDRRGGKNERNGRNDRNDRNGRNDRNNDRRGGKGRNNKRGGQQPAPKMEIARPKHIKLPEMIAVKDLASKMSYTAAEVVKKLFMMGVMATINQEIDFDTAALVASEFGVTCEELPPDVDPTEIPEIEDDPKSLKLRPPVVTVMGHVDHGKTSLLDCIRNTHVSAHEAGGITQHIGAYQVNCKGKKIVFLDTPGHEAFTAMRARGAQITDIAILVVAADDGVMPQTVEAINHAKSANVPIIVAVNKIDKPGANPERVKQELMEHNLVPEEYGGDTIMVPVSAKQQIGIDDLLENVLLVAEVEELKANPNRDARGVIIEAKLDKGRGTVATVLVQNGTLRIGDSVVCGTTYGKVRAMIDDRGNNVKKAGPSVPVEILGLNDVPAAGDILAVLEEKQARSIAEARVERQRTNLIKSKKVSLDDLFHQIQEGEIKDLNIVVKADVQGSVEALCGSLLKLNKNDEVRVSVVHSGVGAVNESDVMLASASNAIIIAFNVRPDANARRVADTEDVDIRTYRVIYDALNDVKDAMSGMLKPKYKEVVQGRVEIRQVMKFSKALVAGSYVLEGKIHNNSKIRIIRDNIEVFDGEIDSLRRFKDEVKEVAAGYECGISIIDFRDFKEGDIIEAYTMEEIATDINEANKEAARKRQAEAAAKAAKENEE
ncbi:putative translation initiation factor IF-2 [Selenomonas ruminantium subsp. lactilytica TAM6421]|uniref:Translation initiation factor IF-2 n=1 Tax=Selenomonas ruminantium subsp. lactilytica (strain NBRC 103574 / TAM6421) TaxID=927704 RepID=I0GRD6_SELRL|nr:translation initiation factor IF-2 [Selenomonas ruminantium]BAL83323.1 putative translation initiation factor IF-2 [Selenomonas ruminantium subsp. lactilytica TAM6421]